MDRQAIMSRALRHGFTLRQQPGGEMDLNDYVYAFAREVFEAGRLAGAAPSPCQGHARQQEAEEARQDSPWIDPNDKTQKQFLPWVGEKVLFCHAGLHGNQSFRFHQPWNPLTDDGDALRLAVALCIEVRNFNGNSHAGKQDQFWCTEGWFPDGDPCAATRRAIVRAAAERQGLK